MRVVILGAGPAGLTVAETLREQGSDAEIAMVSAEDAPPYAPPAMADYFLTGREETLFWKGPDILEQLSVDHRRGVRVRGLKPDTKEVALDGDETLAYDRLVIATGSRLFAPLRGYDLPGVYNFKSLAAATSLVERAREGEVRSALIVGAGFIGVEVALLLADLGLDVTMVELADRVMPKMLDIESAEIALDGIRQRGVTVRLETEAAEFSGKSRATGVRLTSGEVLSADVYIAATGIKPNAEFARDSGIDVAWGIRTDERLRASAPDVYAAGDVAETFDRLTGERYVHAIFPNAVAQGRIVGYNLLGYDAVYEGAETMNSLKHLGLPMMAVGLKEGQEEIRSRRGHILRKVVLSDGKIVGFRLAGDIRGAGFYHSLMLRGADVRGLEEHLLDPRFGAGSLAVSA
jgi:NADPH-dependent 2,4-dienoyl-CoA reductase/sulfur reductase-like enzyme